jgi:ATP-dependent DNA helicase PIF1
MNVQPKIIEYRNQEARKRGIPTYCVFNNKVLEETIEKSPKTLLELADIKGWGNKMIASYGNDIIAIIEDPSRPIPPGLDVTEIYAGRPWTLADDISLIHLFIDETSIEEIQKKLIRQEGGIRARITQHLNRSLPKPRQMEIDNIEFSKLTISIIEKLREIYKIVDKPPPTISKHFDIELNAKQREAYKAICQGKSILLSGEAGTGKTEIIKKFHRDFSKRRNIALTSTTGTSALLMGGTTIHSYLGIGLGKGTAGYIASGIRGKKNVTKRWTDLDILVIDEISMLDPELFDKLDKVGRMIRERKDSPWGGIQLVLSGDFLQLPVVGSDNFTFEAQSWNESVNETFILDENVRQSGDAQWREILSDIRLGMVTEEAEEILKSRVGADVSINGVIPTKLYSKNIDVDRVNDEALDILASRNPDLVFNEYEMNAIKMTKKKISDQVIDSYKSRCIAPEILQLCVGAQVMLLINKLDLGLSNGSRGYVTRITDDTGLPTVRFANGVEIVIERHDFRVNDANGDVEFVLDQLPLKIAYALSIHKSQGITLDCVEVDIRSTFCDGQAYVALSRVKNLEGLSLVGGFNPENIQANEKCITYYGYEIV